MAGLFKKNFLFIYCCLILLAATIYVYSDVHGFGYVNYDDNEYVSENYAIQKGITVESLQWSFTAVHSNNWHPVTWVSHMIDFSLFGINPAGHHVMNAAIHILNVILLFIMLYLLTGVRWPSLIIAALFALHPTHVESVAWIAERKDVLSAFFMFLTIINYWLYIKADNLSKWLYYFLSLVFLALGLMAKPMLVTLPCVLLLLDYWPLDRIKNKLYIVLEKIPFFILAFLSSYLTFWAQNSMGAVQSVDHFPLLLRFQNAFVSVVKYMMKTIYPHPLVVFYPYTDLITPISFILSLLLVVGISLAVLKYKDKKYLLVGWLWFLGTLVPVIGIVQVGTQAMADRYMYITTIGLFIMVVFLIKDLFLKRESRQVPYALILVLLVVLYIPITKKQVSYWESPIQLFEHQLQYEIGTPLILNNLALSYSEKGNTDKAISYYHQALEINPIYFSVLNNLGSALSDKGDINGAIKYYQKAIDTQPNNSLIYKTYNNMGIAAIHQKRFEDAIEHFELALDIEPGYDATYNNMGVALESLGRFEDAIFYYRQGILINPRNSGMYNNIGLVYGKKGDVDKAIDYFRRAIELNPNNQTAKDNLKIAISFKEKSNG